MKVNTQRVDLLPWIVLIALVGLAALTRQADAQAAAFGDRVDVRVVNVEAVVTDKQGVRVFGLGPESFRLIVDGEEVPIEFFSEVRGGDVLEATGASVDVQPIAPGQARGTSYLVFLDEYFMIHADRKRVLRALQDDLGYLGSEDRMAVVAWTGREIEMLSSWTNDTRALRRVLDEAMSRPAYGLQRVAEERIFGADGFDTVLRRTSFGRELSLVERSYIDRLTAQLDNVVAGATSTLRAFAQPPGRKVMMLVSGGWPLSAVDFVSGNPFDPVVGDFYDRTGSLYAPLIETANILGYTLYPIDAPGLEASAADVDASIGSLRGNRFVGRGFYREFEKHSSLRRLAAETGGRALINGQSRRPLELVNEDTRSFYWLGFAADRAGDDAWRDIRVEVDLPKVKVRARGGYRDLSPTHEAVMAVESQLLVDHPAGEPGLEVQLGTAKRGRWGKLEVPVRVRIPAAQIAMVPIASDEYSAQVEILFAAKDDRGHRSDIPGIAVEFSQERAPAPGEVLEFETVLKMRNRAHDMVVAVYDMQSGALLSESVPYGP